MQSKKILFKILKNLIRNLSYKNKIYTVFIFLCYLITLIFYDIINIEDFEYEYEYGYETYM
jgi:hypothetical protein